MCSRCLLGSSFVGSKLACQRSVTQFGFADPAGAAPPHRPPTRSSLVKLHHGVLRAPVRGSRLGDGGSPSQQWSTANGVPSQEVGRARCTNEFGSRRRIQAWLSESTKQLATAPRTRCSPRLSRQARIGRRFSCGAKPAIDCGSSRQASSWQPAKPRRLPNRARRSRRPARVQGRCSVPWRASPTGSSVGSCNGQARRVPSSPT